MKVLDIVILKMLSRFPKMVVLQRFRAEKLGYKPNLAKAIGIAEATKYAIFKNLKNKMKNKSSNNQLSEVIAEDKKIKENLKRDDIFQIDLKNDYPFVGKKVYTENDYDKYFSRYTPEIVDKLEKWAKNIVYEIETDILKNEQKFFNQVWRKVRDEKII